YRDRDLLFGRVRRSRARRRLGGRLVGGQSVIQPVITYAPSVVRNRNRNGPGGMGFTVKNPVSSTGAVVVPALVCVSSVPACSGTTWPNREPSATSSSMDRRAEVKVRARIVAVSDLATAIASSSVRES